jgi:hypothetical protein
MRESNTQIDAEGRREGGERERGGREEERERAKKEGLQQASENKHGPPKVPNAELLPRAFCAPITMTGCGSAMEGLGKSF